MGEGEVYATTEEFDAGNDPIGREYMLVIPGERYPEIVARTSAANGVLALLLFIGAGAVVQRRQPVVG